MRPSVRPVQPSRDRDVRSSRTTCPFDHAELDRLMAEAGITVLLATSPHNVRYLVGAPPFFFFAVSPAFGSSRYMPVVVYVRGRPDAAHYVGLQTEDIYRVEPLWVPTVADVSSNTLDAMEHALGHVDRLGFGGETVGVEMPFLPADAFEVLRRRLPRSVPVDASGILERLRMRKMPHEIAYMREAADRVLDAMVAVFADLEPGFTTNDVARALQCEEVSRGLDFQYCLIAAGASHHRAPQEQRISAGDVVSLDSGGTYGGYVGDVARMGIVGEPDAQLEELLAEIDAVQHLARAAVRPGRGGRDIWGAVESALNASEHAAHLVFDIHGMGLVGHEAPALRRSSSAGGGVGTTLEPGMVISIETAIKHPTRGFIKLEDTLAVTEGGRELFAANCRGWNGIDANERPHALVSG